MEFINYTKELGEYTLPDGVKEKLSGLSIEEQSAFFMTRNGGYECLAEKCSDVLSFIVDDGIIVGVMMSNDMCQPTPCYIGEVVCTWDSEDNNGAGYKTRTEYTRLMFNE